jgi:subtilisin family serine protease
MFRFFKYFAAAAVMAALVSLPFLVSTASSSSEQVSVIVELRDEPAAVYKARTEKSGGSVSQEQLKAYRDQLSAKQDDFLKALASSGVTATVVSRDVKNYDGSLAATVPMRYTLVLDGMALKVSPSAISAIRNMPQVKSVHSDENLITSLNQSVPYIGAPKVYGNAAELTQFDTLNEGYEGQGMYVSIIDTGIDWTHPMFGGDPTPPRLAVLPAGPTQSKTNQKVVYYLPLTDIGVEDGLGHGTHVAATVAGYLGQTMDGTRLHGVAPQAKLLSYKVCSDIYSSIYAVTGIPLGGCASSDTIMALEDSVSPFTLNNPLLPKPVAHVINMSLGGGGGPDNPTAIAASNAALAGAVVVAASGNSGPGEGTTGSPAAGTHVISVGATTHPGSAGAVWSAEMLQASAFPASRVGAVTPASQYPTAAGFNRVKLIAASGSAAVPAGGLAQRYAYVEDPVVWPASVSGRIAILKNYSTSYADTTARAQQAGAVAIIFFDDRAGVNGVKTLIPSSTISTADGEVLLDALSSTDNNSGDPADGAVSEMPIRMNPTFSDTFVGDMASFSSRGPVRGLGQVKPDISAPGVAVFAAVPPASLLGGLATVGGEPNYYRLDGTSMASPHAAGAVTLIKQAHLNWSPDVVRTVLINTATNMRSQSGAPKTDGPDADSIIAQGGGLIDVFHAVNARALMGIAGDGVDKPGILGSHSYGEVPVVNNRITYTAPITVTLRDMSGEGGTYNLNVANNRDLELTGINVALSQPTVTVAANGSATFTVNATFDGDQIRDVMTAKTIGTTVIFEKIQMQWFVTATRSDNKESLRMPFFFRPGPSLPAQPIIQTLTQTAMVPASDVGNRLIDGTTVVEVPFNVSDSTYQVDVNVGWFDRPTGSQEDIDYELLDPDGNVIASSGGPAGASENVSVRVSRGGDYRHRLIGYTNAATDVTITTTLSKGPNAPAAQTIPGDFVDSQGRNIDFDGSFTLQWAGVGSEQGYEIEQSSASNPDWQTIASVGAVTSYNFTNLADDTYSFRVRGIHAGQIGKYLTNAGNAASVTVSGRTKLDITSLVNQAVSNVSLTGGVFQLNLALTNNSAQAYVPLVDLNVIGINAASGTVSVINADNGKNGKSAANAALFSYSDKIGSDETFSANEATGIRTLRFQDSASEMFTYDAVITAYVSTGGGSSSSSSQSGAGAPPAGGGGTSTLLPLSKLKAVMRFTANPLTKTVTAQLIGLK